MARKPIQAAGGIVVRGGARPRIAVVQRSKDERWVLPRGKLERDENPAAGARREAVEETGHRVKVHEFLGAITYRARGRPKVVQFWRMQAAARPSRDVMKDIVAVEWLPLAGGGAAAELSAGEAVPASCRPPRAQAAPPQSGAAPDGATQSASASPPAAPRASARKSAGRRRRSHAADCQRLHRAGDHAGNGARQSPQSCPKSCRNLMRAAASEGHFQTPHSPRIHAKSGTSRARQTLSLRTSIAGNAWIGRSIGDDQGEASEGVAP